MTITPFTIYLISQADRVSTLFEAATITLSIVGVVAGMMFFVFYEDIPKATRSRVPIRKLILGYVLIAMASVLIPSTKTLAAMVIIPAIANSEAIQSDAPELYTLAIEKMKEQLAPAK